MVYSSGVVPFTLLLSAGSVAVSAAATIPWDGGRDLSIHVGSRDFNPGDATSSPNIKGRIIRSSSNVAIVRRIAELVGASPNATHITTTKEVSQVEPPSQGPEIPGLGVPNSSGGQDSMSTTGAKKSGGPLDPKNLVHDGIQGFLNIIAPTDEGPKTLRIASLGFPNDNIGDNPFELGSESDVGSIVYLAPTKPSDVSLSDLLPQASNSTLAMLVARSSFLGVIPSLNTTDSKPPNANAVSSPITVRLKAEATDVETQETDVLCVTYNNNWDLIQDEPPMRLKHCEDSYIPDASSTSSSSSETQLWQYDAITRELRPLVLGIATETTREATTDPSATMSATTPPASTAEVEVMTSPPFAPGAVGSVVPSAVVGKADLSHENTQNSPAQASASPSSIARRDSNETPIASKNGDNPVALKLPKSDSVAQKQDAVARSLMPLAVVDPYTLVFSPRAAARRASVIPQPPA